MEKWILAIVSCSLVGILMVSGCQEQKATAVKDLTNKIVLDSHGLVTFVNSSLTQVTDKSGVVTGVRASWMFQNAVNRTINISINVKFYDALNQLLYNQSKFLENMPAGYREREFGPANWVLYADPAASRVDHVIISTTEYSP